MWLGASQKEVMFLEKGVWTLERLPTMDISPATCEEPSGRISIPWGSSGLRNRRPGYEPWIIRSKLEYIQNSRKLISSARWRLAVCQNFVLGVEWASKSQYGMHELDLPLDPNPETWGSVCYKHMVANGSAFNKVSAVTFRWRKCHLPTRSLHGFIF